jgi:hypothetical protein
MSGIGEQLARVYFGNQPPSPCANGKKTNWRNVFIFVYCGRDLGENKTEFL